MDYYYGNPRTSLWGAQDISNTYLTMMTQDRATHPLATPTSPRNLNPSAPAFRQGQAAPASPKNLNPSAPVFQQSSAGEKSPTEGTYSGAETRSPGLLTNGVIHDNGTNYMVPLGGTGTGMQRGAGPHPQGAQQIQGQGLQSTASMGLAMTSSPLLAAGTQGNQQPVIAAVAPQQQQSAYAVGVPDTLGDQRVQQLVRTSSQNSPSSGIGETGGGPPVGAGVEEETFETAREGQELEGATGAQEYKYQDEVLAPIRKQMQFYFSNENLPNDKFLNQHMDSDKFIPLELFLDFGRIKPICNNVNQLLQAVESSSILELSEDRKKVRVSQCRKTLTLRGFPASSTEEDVRQFILEMGASVPTHIEFVMFKEKYSVWYVSFKDETAALNSFFQFHNQKAVYKDHNIGCCIKSSGTLAAAGYFPSTEESSQRRLAQQKQAAAVVAPVHAVQSAIPQPQPQQAQALMQPFSTMQLHSYMPGSPTGIYYQQTQGPYMPYMTGMIQGWPGPTAAMEPGLIMQNNGLQPQHIRTSVPRPHLMPSGTGAQHRFNRPQRVRQNNIERSASERPSDRPNIVSVSGSSRSSPRSADGNTAATVIPHGAYVPRRATGREDIAPQMMPQTQGVSHQFVTPLVTQQQHITSSAAPATIVNQVSLEPMAVPHYQPVPQQHHQQSVLVHTTVTGTTTTAHPPPIPQTTSNPPPGTQQQMHHHHSQPPPAMHPPQQQHHHHQQQTPHHHHQQQQQQTHHPVQHNNQHHQHQSPQQPHHQQQQPTQAVHHHHQPHHHQPHQQSMMPAAHHHHHSQQQHHPMPPPQVHQQQQHHQQPLLGNRPERRGRRKKEDNSRNPRSERNQSNRANFSSQAPAAADNFTMEANSFPPLPGAVSSITSSEISHENRMSDIVRGLRMCGVGNTSAPRAPSTTPSPVATPIPTPVAAGVPTGQHLGFSASTVLDALSVDDGDSAVDDDTTSSSQEEVDTDINSLESRSVRSEPQSVSFASEQSALPTQARFQKAGTPVSSPATVSSQRQAETRQGSVSAQVPGRVPQQTTAHHHQQQQYQVSPTAVCTVTSSFEAPKLSYAQILAQKNPDAANNVGTGENILPGGLPLNPNSGTPNGPNSAHSNNNTAATPGGGRASSQSTNTFREHGNYQGGQQQQGARSSQRGSSKDLSRSDSSQLSSRPPNGSRRNSKENRTSNKFDRRKPDARQK